MLVPSAEMAVWLWVMRYSWRFGRRRRGGGVAHDERMPRRGRRQASPAVRHPVPLACGAAAALRPLLGRAAASARMSVAGASMRGTTPYVVVDGAPSPEMSARSGERHLATRPAFMHSPNWPSERGVWRTGFES